MTLEGKKIGFAITGSFCSFEQVFIEIEKLVKLGADVYPIISYSTDLYDTKFGTTKEWKIKLEDITGKELIKTIVDAEPIGPTAYLDIIVLTPCTGNTLSKIANAISDTPVTMACKAHLRNNKPIVIGISTNDGLGSNGKNLGLLLNTRNIFFVPFGQDNPLKKPNSLVAKFDKIIPTVELALEGKQIQPLLV